MRLHRFLVDADLKLSSLTITNRDLARQLGTVLRLTMGNELVLTDGKGNEATARLLELGKDKLKLEIIDRKNTEKLPAVKRSLYCSLLKRENFDLVIQKAVELGVDHIVPVITSRTIKLGFNKERSEKIIKEALEQSGRTYLPTISETVPFADSLEQTSNNTTRILFNQGGQSVANLKLPEKDICYWVGPEGGWTNEELQLAAEAGVLTASLSEGTLRAETAAIVATYALKEVSRGL